MTQQTMIQVKISDSEEVCRKRPGPFGPAWALLSKDRQALVIDHGMPAYDAIERMVDNNFSQLPVQNDEGHIIGVFTWKSFSKRLVSWRITRVTLCRCSIVA